jgi:hypothetical protein
MDAGDPFLTVRHSAERVPFGESGVDMHLTVCSSGRQFQFDGYVAPRYIDPQAHCPGSSGKPTGYYLLAIA